MRKTIYNTIAVVALLMTACTKSGSTVVPEANASDDIGGSGQQTNNVGVMTAAEWNDLGNWSFWKDVSSKSDYAKYLSNWNFNTKNRISVTVSDSNAMPLQDALIQLKKSGSVVFTTRSDNKGKAELWLNLFQGSSSTSDLSQYEINVNNGAKVITDVKAFVNGVNTIMVPSLSAAANKIEVSFVVDATSSMDDELKYLKTELEDVISRVKNNNPNSEVLTSSVFYKDDGDDYVTKVSDFTEDVSTTNNFIKSQNTGGGGDNPEAVHTALEKAINDLKWSVSARTRLLFLILDAPPHYKPNVLTSLQNSINKANEMGIKIIPIAASGVDKETEFLLRAISISTNGTYVFITNDSGIGKNHMEASVGAYTVEYLNNLMVRLTNQYSR